MKIDPLNFIMFKPHGVSDRIQKESFSLDVGYYKHCVLFNTILYYVINYIQS